MHLISVSFLVIFINLKKTLRKVLLVTPRHVVGSMAKGGEGYVKIHNGRACKALWRYRPNGSVL